MKMDSAISSFFPISIHLSTPFTILMFIEKQIYACMMHVLCIFLHLEQSSSINVTRFVAFYDVTLALYKSVLRFWLYSWEKPYLYVQHKVCHSVYTCILFSLNNSNKTYFVKSSCTDKILVCTIINRNLTARLLMTAFIL